MKKSVTFWLLTAFVCNVFNVAAASVLDVSVFDVLRLAQACNNRLSLQEQLVVADAVFFAAKKHRVPVSEILGIITVESTFDKKARSWYGALGLMQVVPRFHRERIGRRDILSPRTNVDVGTEIYTEYIAKYGRKAGLVKYSGAATNYGEKVSVATKTTQGNTVCPK